MSNATGQCRSSARIICGSLHGRRKVRMTIAVKHVQAPLSWSARDDSSNFRLSIECYCTEVSSFTTCHHHVRYFHLENGFPVRLNSVHVTRMDSLLSDTAHYHNSAQIMIFLLLNYVTTSDKHRALATRPRLLATAALALARPQLLTHCLSPQPCGAFSFWLLYQVTF